VKTSRQPPPAQQRHIFQQAEKRIALTGRGLGFASVARAISYSALKANFDPKIRAACA
jgi:hypothetical protein